MKLYKSFIAKFVQASLFSCLSFFAYAQDVNSEENKPLPLNDEGYEAREKSITDNINKAVEDIKEKEKKLNMMLNLKTIRVVLRERKIKIYQGFSISIMKMEQRICLM